MISAGVITACFGAFALPGFVLCAPADCGCNRAAEIAGKSVDREGAAHPRLIHVLGQDRVIGGMIDAVGEPKQHGAGDQGSVAQMQAEQDQREPAERQSTQQDPARAKMVDEIAGRRLRQPGHDGRHGQREPELDIADTKLALQEREQHRQDQQMEMADPMRDRDPGQRAQRTVRLALLRCGENVDHCSSVSLPEGAETIGEGGYLSMNAGAWQVARVGEVMAIGCLHIVVLDKRSEAARRSRTHYPREQLGEDSWLALRAKLLPGVMGPGFPPGRRRSSKR